MLETTAEPTAEEAVQEDEAEEDAYAYPAHDLPELLLTSTQDAVASHDMVHAVPCDTTTDLMLETTAEPTAEEDAAQEEDAVQEEEDAVQEGADDEEAVPRQWQRQGAEEEAVRRQGISGTWRFYEAPDPTSEPTAEPTAKASWRRVICTDCTRVTEQKVLRSTCVSHAGRYYCADSTACHLRMVTHLPSTLVAPPEPLSTIAPKEEAVQEVEAEEEAEEEAAHEEEGAIHEDVNSKKRKGRHSLMSHDDAKEFFNKLIIDHKGFIFRWINDMQVSSIPHIVRIAYTSPSIMTQSSYLCVVTVCKDCDRTGGQRKGQDRARLPGL